jgi:hypothetical protein
MASCLHGKAKLVKLLLDNEADPTIPEKDGTLKQMIHTFSAPLLTLLHLFLLFLTLVCVHNELYL